MLLYFNIQTAIPVYYNKTIQMYHQEDPYQNPIIDEDEFDFEVREPSLYNESTIASTVDSKKKRMRKNIDDYKKIDSAYHKKKIIVDFKKVDVEFYVTPPLAGGRIRDAITGMRMGHLVCSKYEDLYFKVRIAIGQEAYSLYYDSPEQYERHMNVTISQSDKQKWMEKCVSARIKTN